MLRGDQNQGHGNFSIMKLSQSKKFAKLRALLDKNPHPADKRFNDEKFLIDKLNGSPVRQVLLGAQRPLGYKANSFVERSGPLFFTHRRNLLQFEDYMEANTWCTNRFNTQGPCSFFIKGYQWPWHTRKNYVGLLFPANAAPRKSEKI